LVISDANWRAFEAVNCGDATKEQRQLTNKAASGARWLNPLAQAAQDARDGKLKSRSNYG